MSIVSKPHKQGDKMQLTIYHDGQFWVAVIEVIEKTNLRAYKYTFGAEPTDTEILTFVNSTMQEVLSESKSQGLPITVEDLAGLEIKRNPKRAARDAARALQERGASTFAQQVIKIDIENRKVERKAVSRDKKEEIKERKYSLSREKAKRRHRGK
jgi:hypothetical protein